MRSTTAHAAKFFAAVVLAGWLVGPHAGAPGGDVAPASRAFPLRFEAREAGGPLVAATLGGTVAVSGDTIALTGHDGVETLRLTLRDESPAEFAGDQPSQGPTRVVTDITRDVATYRTVRARGIAPGVDAVVAGEGGRLELRFEVGPGAEPSSISLVSSASVLLDAAGRAHAASWVVGAPLSANAHDPQAAAPVVRLEATAEGRLVLALPAGDPAGPIDIRVPIWESSSVLRTLDPAKGAPRLALDADGNAYVIARAPARSGDVGDPGDLLVARLDRSGTDYSWVTYLSGPGDDDPRAITVDANRRVVVAGRGAAGPFAATFDAVSGSLAGVLPLQDGDEPRAIAADGAGAVWIAGAAGTDGFVARIDADGTVTRSLVPGGHLEAIAVAADGSTVAAAGAARVEVLSADGKVTRTVELGALGIDRIGALALALARDGRIIAAGRSAGAGAGGSDAVLAEIEPDEGRASLLQRIAGPGADDAASLVIDRAGNLIVAGRAGDDLALPVTSRRALRGGADGFVSSYDTDGRSALYGAYLGGSSDDAATSVAVDGNGRVWAAGVTRSSDTREDEATFPLGGGGVGFVVVLDDLPAPAGVCPGDKQFDGGPTGTATEWELAENWSGDTLPTAGQNVCITGAFAVDVGAGSQNAGTLRVEGGASLSINAGTLTIAGTSEINGPFTMSGGTLTGAGNISTGSTFTYETGTIGGTGSLTAAAGMTFSTAGFRTLSRNLLIPAGQTATYSATGGMAINTPATMTNAGTWNHQTDADITGTGLFVNSGTFNRTNSSGLVTMGVDFNNTGTVDVQSGQLAFSGNGTDTGDYDATSAILRFSGGTRSMSATTAITGGDVEITNGTYTFNGTYDIAGTTDLAFGSFTFTATSVITSIGSALSLSGGTLTLSSGDVVDPATVDQTGGTLTGSDAVNVSGLYTFDGGTMSGIGATTASGGIAFGTASFRTISRNLSIPAGQTSTYSGTGGMAVNTPATVTNAGTWDHQTDADISGTGLLSNSGTFNRTNSAGLVTIGVDFNNTGSVDVQSGVLSFTGDGVDTGDYDATGAILRFALGTRSMSAATAITGGNVEITNGTHTFNGSYDVAGTTSVEFGTFTWTAASTIVSIGAVLDVSGGTATLNSGDVVTPGSVSHTAGIITGSDTINVSGLYTFNGGTMSGTGTTNANGGTSIGSASFKTIARNFVNPAGQALTYSGTGGMAVNTPATVTNAGAWEHQTDADVTGTGHIVSSGTFTRTNSAGLVNVGVNFNNTGSVDVQSGILAFSGDGVDTGDYDSAGAALRLAGGVRSMSATTAITGGDVDITNGTYTFNGTYDVAGTTNMNFGSFTFTATSVITSIGSTLSISNGTLTFNSGSTLAPTVLTQTGGTITGSDNIDVSGQFTFDGGTHSGNGTTTANGGVAFGSPSFRTLARVLIIPGSETATYAGTGGMAINTPGVLTNDGIFEHQTDADVSGTGVFNNTGTFNRTNSAGIAAYSVDFNNTGLVDVQSGELRLSGDGVDTGDYDCTGAILTFAGGTRTIGSASVMTGSEVRVTNGTITINASYDIANRTFMSFGTVTFTSQATITDIGAALDVDAGTMTFNSGETVAPTTVNLAGGTITGSDALTVSGLFTWESGTLSGSGAATANGGMALTTSGNKSLSRNLTNSAGSTATVSGAGGLGITAPAVLTNSVGGTWDHQTEAQVTGTGSFNNLGTFNRTTSSGELLWFCDFDNVGTVDVQSGSLHFNGGGTGSGSYDSTGTLLRLGSGTYTFTSTSAITGTDFEFRFCTATLDGSYNITGTTLFSGGDATFAPPSTITSVGATLDLDSGNAVFNSGDAITVGTLLMTGGNLSGSDNVNVTGPVDWDSGQMSGTGTTTLQGGLTIDNFGVTLARPLVNATGSTAVTSGPNAAIFFSQGGSVTNQPGATWEVQNDGGYADPGNVAFNNAGTFKRTTSSEPLTIDLPFTNTGTVDVPSGSITAQNYTQNAGLTRLGGGNLASGTFPIRIFGGSLIGNGTITGNVTIGTATPATGAFAPGFSAGTIAVTGTTTFAAGGSYACEIGGLTAGTQHDFLGGAGSGPFAVGGTLDVSLMNGFNPGVGNTFTIIQGSSRTGTFAVTNLPPLGGGNVWNVIYTPTTVVLSVGPPISADLSVTNVDAPDPVNAGGNVTYTVTVASAGPDPATGVTLTDTLDATTSFISATPSQGTCGHAAGTVTCNLGNLANGASATVTIGVSTSAGSVPSITSTATVAGTEADLNSANNAASATTTVTPVADLSIVKSDTPDPVAAAGTLTYTLDVSNAGPNDATSLTVTDTLPAGVAFVSATGTGWACGNVAQTVTCTRPTLAQGAAPSITVTVTAPASPGPITNNASVTATSFDPTTPNTASAGTSVTAVADLTITKGDAPDPVDAGATLTYTLGVSNAGPSAANTVSVTDTLPAGVAFVSATGTGWTCGHVAGVVTCARPTLAVGVASAITITVTAPVTGGTITNSASTTAAEFDPTTPNTVTEDTDVTAIADLSVTKTDSPDPANTSSQLTYTVTVTNNGPSPATSVVALDALPAGVTFVSATGTGWVCNEASLIVTCTRAATLPVGAAPEITIVVTTPATPGLISNGVSAGAAEEDRDPDDNVAAAQTSVALITADLSITKTDSADPVNAGAALSYTLTVANAGPDPATTVTVTDTLPAGVAFVSATGAGWTCGEAAGVVTCTRTNLGIATAPAITIAVTAPVEGGLITNTASVSAPEADNDAGDNTDSEGTTVNALANLTIAKTDSPDPVAASGTITYTIDIGNAGPSTATSLTMTDTLPAGVSFVSATSTGWTCSQLAGVVSCTRAVLAVGAAPAITIVVTAPASAGSITNNASVTASEPDPSTPNTASATTSVTAVADLTIAKTDGPDPINAGQNLTYTINVSNAGPSTANSVSVTDPLPAGSGFVSATGTGWTCNQAALTVTCTRPTLAVGAAPAIAIVITPPPAGGQISNTATATATEFDPTTPNTSTTTTDVVPIADLSMVKVDTPDPVNIGSALTYNLAVTNLGPSPATSVTVTDTLPGTVAFVSATGTGWTCGHVAGVVTCTRATLATGAAPVIAITLTAPGSTGPISNTATVATTTTDPVAGNNTDTEGTTVTTVTADLSIAKVDTPDPVNTGANLTYTLTVTNAGPDPASSISVVDTLPAGVTFNSATGSGWTCGHTAGVVTCTRATLAVGAAPVITIQVAAPSVGGPITNNATVSAGEADGNLANNTALTTTTVNVVADLSIAKTDAPDPVLAGGTLTYTVTVTNLSAATASGVTVTDTLPPGTAFVSAAGSGWTCNNVGQTVTCTRATLATGAAPAITITVTAPAAGGAISNTATVASTSTDPVATNNSASASTTVTAVADLSLVKTDSADPVNAGATFTYTLAVSNAGPSTASTVTVTDPLPAGMIYVSAAGSGWTCSQASGTVTCTRTTLAVGPAPAITITVRAPAAGGSYSNTATVTSPTQDPDAPDRTDTETTDVVPAADLSITKATTASTVNVGAVLTWTLSVRNLGPSAATNVVVTDLLPAGVSFVSATGSGWTCAGPIPVTCTRATLASGAVSTITLNATAPLVPGPIVNAATIEAAENDPVATNDTGQSTVDAVVGGACGTLEDLLEAVDDASIDPTLQRSLEAPLRAAIAAEAVGQTGVAAAKLGVFQQHCLAASASGRIDPDDAEELLECAASLRQSLADGGAGAAAVAPAKKGGAKPGTPPRRR